MLQAAIADGDADPAQAAFLEDRIATFEGRPQRYGTQFDWDDQGRMSPLPLAEPERVDELRRSVGLGSLAERIAEVRANNPGEPPLNQAERRAAFEAWLREVGWR